MDTLTFATQLARETGEILLQYYHPRGLRGELKSDRTVVTEADLAADEFLRKSINRTFPDDGILSEECEMVYPDNKSAVWIIDPLDGTTNFSLGLHYWGVSIARLVDGEPSLGVLYFPLLDELYTASKGGGAFLNDSQLIVSPPNANIPATFFSCCSRTQKQYDVQIKYKHRIWGSAAYGLATVARGSAILAFEVTPKVWDFSASWLITREAGGIIAPLDGSLIFPLQGGIDYEKRSYPLLVAPTQEMWDKSQKQIKPK